MQRTSAKRLGTRARASSIVSGHRFWTAARSKGCMLRSSSMLQTHKFPIHQNHHRSSERASHLDAALRRKGPFYIITADHHRVLHAQALPPQPFPHLVICSATSRLGVMRKRLAYSSASFSIGFSWKLASCLGAGQ
jgi:hypothetical protein